MTDLTINYRFVLPDYNSTGWDTAIDDNLIAIDALLAQYSTGINLQGLWKNGTKYVAGVSVIDGLTGHIWACGITNTSIAAPGLFATDRSVNALWWTDITNPSITASSAATQAAASATASANSATNAANSVAAVTAQAAIATTQATNAANSASAAANNLASILVLSTFRNRLINGNFDIDQRNNGAAVTVTPGNGSFLVDRWQTLTVVGGNATFQQTITTDIPFRSQLAITFAAGNTFTHLNQRIESGNCADLDNASIVVSGYIWVDQASSASLSIAIGSPSATDNYGTETFSAAQVVAMTPNSWVQFSKTFVLPSTASRGIDPLFIFSNFGSRIAVLAGVQVEIGTTATVYERRPYGLEFALCQRYYQKGTFGLLGYQLAGAGYGANQPLPVTMRATPTITSNFTTSSNATTPTVTATNGSSVAVTCNATATSGVALAGSFTASAEL